MGVIPALKVRKHSAHQRNRLTRHEKLFSELFLGESPAFSCFRYRFV